MQQKEHIKFQNITIDHLHGELESKQKVTENLLDHETIYELYIFMVRYIIILFTFTINEAWRALLRLVENQSASQLPLFFFFSLPHFWNNWKFGAKKYFTDLRTANPL